MAIHNSLQKFIFFHKIGCHKLFTYCSQFYGRIWHQESVPVNVVRNFHRFIWLNRPQYFLEVLFITWCPVGMDFDFAFLENIHSLLTRDLKNFLVRSEDFFMKFFSDFDLKPFSPVADVKETRLDDSESILLTDFLPQLIMKFFKSFILLFRGKLMLLILFGYEIILSFLDKIFI